MEQWFKQNFERRAPKGGAQRFGRSYHGGAFMPFYVPRPVMPQIDEEDYPEFIEFAASRGVEVRVRYFEASALKPHQVLDKFDARRMPPSVKTKTVFASVDQFILDGNHRWMYHRVNKSRVPTFQVMLDFNAAIELMFAFPKTYRLETHSEQN